MELKNIYQQTIYEAVADDATRKQFLERLEKGDFTRDEEPASHFCSYFPAISDSGEIFIGKHIKSGLWLPNGGHIDRGETPYEAQVREISEEWGPHLTSLAVPNPSFLTVTKLTDSAVKRSCRVHFDIWFFIPVDKETFNPDSLLLASEFHEYRWVPYAEARELTGCPSVKAALAELIDRSSIITQEVS